MPAVLLAAIVYISWQGRRELQRLEKHHSEQEGELRADLLQTSLEIAGIRKSMEALERKSEPAGTNSFNPGLRIQAIRMIRAGEPAAEIATELRVPRNQVELLVKVQRLLADPVLS